MISGREEEEEEEEPAYLQQIGMSRNHEEVRPKSEDVCSQDGRARPDGQQQEEEEEARIGHTSEPKQEEEQDMEGAELEKRLEDIRRRWQELERALQNIPAGHSPDACDTTALARNVGTTHHRKRGSRSRRVAGTRSASGGPNSSPSSLLEGRDQEGDDDLEQVPTDHDEEDNEDQSSGASDGASSKSQAKRKSRRCRRGGRWANNRKLKANSNPVYGSNCKSLSAAGHQSWRKQQVGLDGLTDEERWDLRIGELHEFKRRYGHVNVPQKWSENQKLANWLKNVRQRWTHVEGYLPPDKENVLFELGVKKCEPVDVAPSLKGKRKRGTNISSSSAEEDDAANDSADDADSPQKRIKSSIAEHLSAPREEEHPQTQDQEQSLDDPFLLRRRSERKRKPLFDLEQIRLLQREEISWATRRRGGRGKGTGPRSLTAFSET